MADQFSRLYDVERVGGDQRTRLAELLRSQGMNQQQGQMVGGWYVPPSWSQSLNSAVQMGLGTYMGGKIDEEKKAKTAELLRQLSQGKEVEPIPATQNFNGMERMAEGQTPMPQQAPQNELERLTRQPQMPVEQSQMNPAMAPRQEQRYVPLSEEEKIGKVMELAQYNPYAAQVWSAQDTARQNRLTRAEERAVDREFKREQLQQQQEGRMDLARLTGAIAASNRVAPQDKPLTEYQGKAVTFGTRAAQSHNILNALEESVNPLNVAASRKGGMLVNWAMDTPTRQVEQAQRDFINAVLRQESGAAIGKDEYESAARQYFPEPSDPPEVIAQKRAARETQIRGFAKQAGAGGAPEIVNAYNTPYALPKAQEQKPASQGRLSSQSTMPPTGKFKFLGFE